MANRKTTEHISAVIGLLNRSAHYAVLRNYDGLPESNQSRDIDIIITEKSFKTIRNELVQLINNSGWKIVVYLNSDRLITFVCGIQEGNNTEMVQWDFFINTSLFGIVLMEAEEFLTSRQYNGFLYYVDINSEFLDKYLYYRAVGIPYPEKYASVKKQAEHSTVVKEKIFRLFGVPSLEACDQLSCKQLRFRALLSNLRNHPIETTKRMLCFLYTFVRNYFSSTGFSMGFTGADGCGKTTLIALLIKRLSPVFEKAHRYYHFRPELFGNISDVAQSAGLKKEVDREYSSPHRGGKTGKFASFLRLLYYATDYLFGYFIKVKPTVRITRLAIFDRYYTDIVCDSRRSRIYLSYKFLYRFGRLFIPTLDYNVLLTANVETILSRKAELDKEDILLINKKIDYLSKDAGYMVIHNDHTPDDAINNILENLFECQNRKNLKRL